MRISERVISPCWTTADVIDEPSEFDLATFVANLLFFEHFMVQSHRLTELPHLVRHFGVNGVLTLLESGLLSFYCNASSIGESGRTRGLQATERKGILPLLSYRLVLVGTKDRAAYIESCLGVVNEIAGLTSNQRERLRAEVTKLLVAVPENFGLQAYTTAKDELERNSRSVTLAAEMALRQRVPSEIGFDFLKFRVHRMNESDFRVETNIRDIYGWPVEDVHALGLEALFGIGHVNAILETMRTFDGVSGVREGELPLLAERLDFLAERLSPNAEANRFTRTLNVLGLPSADSHSTIDADKLLRARNSREFAQFREWLQTTDSMTDDGIRDAYHPIADKVKEATRGNTMKALRWVITGIAGAIAPPAGLGLGVLDTFVVDKVLPTPGPTAFLGSHYHSLFRTEEL